MKVNFSDLKKKVNLSSFMNENEFNSYEFHIF